MPVQFSQTTRALHGETARTALWAWLISGSLIAVWVLWFFLGRVTLYETSTHARLEVMQAPHALNVLVAGKIAVNELRIGQEVQAGEVLVELDSTAEQLRLREEESRLQAYAPRLQSLRREITVLEKFAQEAQRSSQAATEAARLRHKEASTAAAFALDNERRMRDESRAGSVARIEALRATAEAQKLGANRDALGMETRRLEMEAATHLHQNQAQMESLRRTMVALEGEAATVTNTIARLKLDIERHRLRAPISGRLGDVMPLRTGAYVPEGQKLATVVPRGALIILADLNPSAVLGRVHAGQRARLRLDGFPWAQFGVIDARVTQVASEIRDNVVRVELTPLPRVGGRAVMQHGLPGVVEIAIEELSPAMLMLRHAGQLLTADAPASQNPQEERG